MGKLCSPNITEYYSAITCSLGKASTYLYLNPFSNFPCFPHSLEVYSCHLKEIQWESRQTELHISHQGPRFLPALPSAAPSVVFHSHDLR